MDLDGQEKKVVEEIEQELLVQQQPPKEIKTKEIKREVADEQKPDVQSSSDLPKSVEKKVKNCENLIEEKEQKFVQEQKPLKKIEVKQKEDLTDEHKPEADLTSSPDLKQNAEKNVENKTNFNEQSTSSCNNEIKENKEEIQETEINGAQAAVVQAEVNDARDADMEEFDELMNANSDSSDFEMTPKESDKSDEENSSKQEGLTSEPGNEEGVSKSVGVLKGRDDCVKRVDVSTEDVSSKEETSDNIDCDNKVSDNLDVSRESIEAALTDMMEAAEDVIKSLESESQ
jgi:hypothetical protein